MKEKKRVVIALEEPILSDGLGLRPGLKKMPSVCIIYDNPAKRDHW